MALYETPDGGAMISLDLHAFTFNICEHGGCDACPHDDDGPRLTMFVLWWWNVLQAVALAAAAQAERVRIANALRKFAMRHGDAMSPFVLAGLLESEAEF